MRSTAKIKLDLRSPSYGSSVYAVQGDGDTRCIVAALLDGGKPWTVPAGVTASVAYRKQDNTIGQYDKLADGTQAVTVSGSTATVVLARQMLTDAGVVQASIVFNDEALNQLTTFPFTVNVAYNPFSGGEPSQDYIRLQWLEDKLDAYMEKYGGATDEAAIKRIVDAYLAANPPEATDSGLEDAVLTATGDSITAQETNYAKLIADQFGMDYENVAMGGGTVASGIYNVDGTKRPCICDTIGSMRQDADIILLSGGVNDQVELNHDLEALGELTDGFDKTLNKATLYGALEYMLRQAVFKWSNKTILYVLPHRMTSNLDYRGAVLAACRKYGIPVVDLMDSTMDFYTLPEFKEQYTANSDGWHPNENGYRSFYVPQILAAIRKHFRGKGDTITLTDSNMPEVICVNTSVPTEDIYTPDIAGFIRMNGTISTSANYLRTDYLPLSGKTDIEYNVFIANSDMATWALFDGDKNWLASSEDGGGTDYWHTSASGGNLMIGWKHNTLSVGDLLESYPTAAYIVLSTNVNPDYETIYDGTSTNFGWGTDDAYITLK